MKFVDIIELISTYNKKFREVKNKDRFKLTQEFINDYEKLKKKRRLINL